MDFVAKRWKTVLVFVSGSAMVKQRNWTFHALTNAGLVDFGLCRTKKSRRLNEPIASLQITSCEHLSPSAISSIILEGKPELLAITSEICIVYGSYILVNFPSTFQPWA